jgi:ABC-type sugar transport system ATPase subunit
MSDADQPSVALEVANVAKRYGSVQALHEVSLAIRAGEVHGICGHNGAGKSTLVRILSGLTRPDAGEVRIGGELVDLRHPKTAQAHGVALVDQELSLVPVLSVEDNIFLGSIAAPLRRRTRQQRAETLRLLARVGLEHVHPDAAVGGLSIGERQLVEIARLLGREAQILILDEPTATLSESEITKVFAVIRELAASGRSVIFVSHRLVEVLSLCDRVSVFRDGALVGTHGTRELARETLVSLIIGDRQGAAVDPGPHRARQKGEVRLSVRDLTVPRRVRGLELDLCSGEIVGLAGQLNSGASETLRAIAGLVADSGGHLAVDGKRLRSGSPIRAAAAGIRYASYDRQAEGLFLGQSSARNLLACRHERISRHGFLLSETLKRLAAHLAAIVGLATERLRNPVGQLSGGNQQKVLVGRQLDLEGAGVLLFDDPTRGVDVGARAEIHRLVRAAADSGRAVLVASTEMEELLELSDVIVTMFAGRAVSKRPVAQCSSASVFAEMTLGQPTLDAERAVEHA